MTKAIDKLKCFRKMLPNAKGSFSKGLVLLMATAVAFSCKQNTAFDFERDFITVNKQQFEILTAWQLFDSYLVEQPDYTRHIFKRIESEFDNNMAYPFLLDVLRQAIPPDEKLKEEVVLMKDIDFVGLVATTFQLVTQTLPGPHTKILFLPANPVHREVYREFGIGFHAFTLGAGKIIVSFDPTFDNWQLLLPYALAHEYHHSVWISRNFETSEFTPLEYLILEGRADSFANELFPNTKHPFLNALSDKEIKSAWNAIKPELHVRNSELNDQMMAGSKEIPTGSVYSIGFAIIESFKMNNPQIGDKELMDMSPEQILLLSKFDD